MLNLEDAVALQEVVVTECRDLPELMEDYCQTRDQVIVDRIISRYVSIGGRFLQLLRDQNEIDLQV